MRRRHPHPSPPLKGEGTGAGLFASRSSSRVPECSGDYRPLSGRSNNDATPSDRQQCPCPPRVLVHLCDERLDVVEPLLASRIQPTNSTSSVCAVEVAGKIEQEDFEKRRAVVEGRPAAEVRDTVEDAVADRRRARRKSRGEGGSLREAQVGRRIAERPSALVAVPRPRLGRTSDSRANRWRSRRRRSARPSRIALDETCCPARRPAGRWRSDALPAAKFLKAGRSALARPAEVKVVTDGDAGRAKIARRGGARRIPPR